MTVVAAVPVLTFLIGLIRRNGFLVALRMTIQAAFLMLFLVLLTQAVLPLDGYEALGGRFPVDFFVRLSPLLAVAAMLAGQVFIAGLLLGGMTLLSAVIAGRFFCGWMCPLGTTFDIFDWLFLRHLDRPGARDGFLRGVKYLALVGILVAALFGAEAAGWFDPMSIVTRSYAIVVLPVADEGAKVVLEKPLEHETFRTDMPRLAKALARTDSTLKDLNILYDARHYYFQFATLGGVFAALLLLQAYQKRFWCRKVCPLGGMLAICGKWRPLGVYLDSGTCVDCGKCRQVCPVGAIQGKALSPEECTFCGSCVAPCPVDALSVRVGAPASVEKRPAVLPGRREFLLAAASGIAAAPVLSLNTQRQADQVRLVRPPGAQDEERFVAACVRCGECMKACPQNALHPAGFQAGLAGVWTPRIVPVIGYCDYNCLTGDQPVGNFCATVCPTGAIKKLSPEEKHKTRLGTAYFRTDKCIPYVERLTCSVCAEHCPVPEKAIKDEEIEVKDFKTGVIRKILRPYVDTALCIGCGQCENVCPLRGEKGIRVERVRSVV